MLSQIPLGAENGVSRPRKQEAEKGATRNVTFLLSSLITHLILLGSYVYTPVL